ncbi:MAG: hypothetical protein QXY87_10215 [Saccharolobus sp.]|uniref:hypothetical protein n=1 Tax=Saccharolobus TaxID=2100760 RepID=UPI001F0ECA66|nr:hypothetical protein [Saccharolobus shibatae]MCH4814679.1 hypothetical protein [Saccharolobus shibatae]
MPLKDHVAQNPFSMRLDRNLKAECKYQNTSLLAKIKGFINTIDTKYIRGDKEELD